MSGKRETDGPSRGRNNTKVETRETRWPRSKKGTAQSDESRDVSWSDIKAPLGRSRVDKNCLTFQFSLVECNGCCERPV